MTYTVIASNPNTNEIGIASTTITINFGRAFPVTRHLTPELLDKGIIVAPMIRGSKQILKKFVKKKDKIETEKLSEVLFVPNLSGIKD